MIIFEVWSPNNTAAEMDGKRQFYEQYGAEEFYLVYPDHPMHAEGWLRDHDKLVKVPAMDGFVSPRLGLRFELMRGRLKVFGSDGRELKRPDEIAREWDEAEQRAKVLADKLRELGIDPDSLK